MRHTATDLRPPPPAWTANPQTPAQLSTHTIGLRRWILARTAIDFSIDPKAPAIRHRPGADKGGNKDAACPPGRLASSTSATAALPRAPIPLPCPMGQHGSWPRCSHVSRMGKGVVGVVNACARGIRPAACASQVFYIDSSECYRSH